MASRRPLAAVLCPILLVRIGEGSALVDIVEVSGRLPGRCPICRGRYRRRARRGPYRFTCKGRCWAPFMFTRVLQVLDGLGFFVVLEGQARLKRERGHSRGRGGLVRHRVVDFVEDLLDGLV